jgi:hypothetical protein
VQLLYYGKNLLDIKLKLGAHDVHILRPSPYGLQMNDFKPNDVELMSDAGRFFTYRSQLFCSGDYCVAVIIKKDYDSCIQVTPMESKESQDSFLNTFSVFRHEVKRSWHNQRLVIGRKNQNEGTKELH